MTKLDFSAPPRLDGKVVLVTGASRGIGRALAVAMARAGARLSLVARTEAALADTAALVDPADRRNVVTVGVDLAGESAAQRVLDATIERFGTVDVLVNNAGIHYATPFLETSAEGWRNIIDVNLLSVVNLTRVVGQHLVAQKSGSVINISSAWARKAIPPFSAYTTSKAALSQFTRAIAREWARTGVRVNAIAPGYFATDISKEGMEDPATYERMLKAVPQRRIGRSDEISPLAIYLASDLSSYVTGSSFTIDGGMDLA